jgi:nitrous oxidase accessory protein
MPLLWSISWLWPMVCIVALVGAAPAEEIVDLQTLIDAAAPGDTLRLGPERYSAAIIDKPLVLIGQERLNTKAHQTVIDGGGTGHVLQLQAPDIAVHSLRLVGSGTDIDRKESGVWIDRQAPRASLSDLEIENCGFGIWADAVKSPQIIGCRIIGNNNARLVSDLGNGIHLFNVTDGLVRDNHISQGRDGIYISNSTGCRIQGNRIDRSRFAIHYMYSHANQVVGNHTDSSSVGIALMYSKALLVQDNQVRASRNHGILLRNLYYSRITGNRTTQNKDGFFFSGCSYDTLDGNFVSANETGIHVSDSADNLVTGNAFVDNDEQLNYQDNSILVWDSEQGGNYWSDYVGWDRNGDGLGDRPHHPTDISSYLVQRFPAIRLVLHSPAMALLRGLESRFPVIRPPGVREPRPLMANPITPPARAVYTLAPNSKGPNSKEPNSKGPNSKAPYSDTTYTEAP